MFNVIIWLIFLYILTKLMIKIVKKTRYGFDEEPLVEDYGTRTTYHIVHETGSELYGWWVKKEGDGLIAFAKTKEEAVNLGKDFAKAHVKGQLIIHREDGTFQEEFTYGHDPKDIKG